MLSHDSPKDDSVVHFLGMLGNLVNLILFYTSDAKHAKKKIIGYDS